MVHSPWTRPDTRASSRRLEWAADRITVNAVAPGPIATSLFLDGKTEEQIQTFAKMPPLQRLGQPDDIASVVSFLAGPDASGPCFCVTNASPFGISG